jgi:hypothetical protein
MARRLWRLRRGQEAGWPLFATSRGLSRPLHESNMRCRVLNPAREEVGLEWVGFHVLRHTCASLLFEEGRNIAQGAAWLGSGVHAADLRAPDGRRLGEADFLDVAVQATNQEVGVIEDRTLVA